jgi:two-component system, NarL family, response regulator NreC
MAHRILIVDDHGVLRAGLAALLAAEPGLQVVGEAESAEQALSQVEFLKPDVILMDISLQGKDGIEATRLIKTSFPATHVLILTVHEDKGLLRAALDAGASGYILKQAVKNELIIAIQAVMQNHIYIHPAMTRALLPDPVQSEGNAGDEKGTEALTQRELEVLKLVVQGYTNNQTAKLLNVSVRTVEYHRGNIMAKLGLDSRVELMRYAEKHHLT